MGRGRLLRLPMLATALVAACPSAVHAGMSFYTMTDAARIRLQTTSFFLVVLLICALLVKLIWNYLRRDFTRLPRLTYFKACGLVILLGLAFMLVLSMIAGARELMTPGAWTKQETAYRLNDREIVALETARKEHLELLRVALWRYAEGHANQFPAHEFVPEIPANVWETLDPSGVHFVYLPGRAPDAGERVVAYEPGIYGEKRWVLFSNGKVKQMSPRDIDVAVGLEGVK